VVREDDRNRGIDENMSLLLFSYVICLIILATQNLSLSLPRYRDLSQSSAESKPDRRSMTLFERGLQHN
jgi:hypothetical protein